LIEIPVPLPRLHRWNSLHPKHPIKPLWQKQALTDLVVLSRHLVLKQEHIQLSGRKAVGQEELVGVHAKVGAGRSG
jgi:hypothetical protein